MCIICGRVKAMPVRRLARPRLALEAAGGGGLAAAIEVTIHSHNAVGATDPKCAQQKQAEHPPARRHRRLLAHSIAPSSSTHDLAQQAGLRYSREYATRDVWLVSSLKVGREAHGTLGYGCMVRCPVWSAPWPDQRLCSNPQSARRRCWLFLCEGNLPRPPPCKDTRAATRGK